MVGVALPVRAPRGVKALRPAVNVLVYQCAWFACVLSAAASRQWIGVAVAAGVVLLHLYLAPAPRRELPLILAATLVGAAFESLLVASGWAHSATAGMVALWAAFATTLNVSLRALRQRYLVTAAIAAVGAPLAYQAGAALGALHWVQATPALLLVACGWAVLLPVLMHAAQRFDGFAAP